MNRLLNGLRSSHNNEIKLQKYTLDKNLIKEQRDILFCDFTKLNIGRSGEFYYNQYLTKTLDIPSKDGKFSVEWVNEDKETGLPYDFIVKLDDIIFHIDVKATIGRINNYIYISKQELSFSQKPNINYKIARLFSSDSDRGKAKAKEFNVVLTTIDDIKDLLIIKGKDI